MKVKVEFDTNSKYGTVTLDGEIVDNVRSVCLYNMDYSEEPESKFYMEIRTMKHDKDNKTTVYTSVEASQNGQISKEESENKSDLHHGIANLLLK